ncbi:MAG: hypothetical protein V1866_04210 [archaeon]
MSKKGIRFKAKYENRIAEECEIKETRDGSKIIIPKKENSDGLHASLHPSGIFNLSSGKSYVYDFLNNPKLKEFVEKRVNDLEKIDCPIFAIILDLRDIKKYASIKDNEHIVDFDAYFMESEQVEIQNDDFSFVLKYNEPFYEIIVFDEELNAFYAAKNKPGYGMPLNPKKD